MADRFIPEHRRTQFKAKNTFKPDELRRRREEQQVEIRKAKREENLAKRRGITARDGSQTAAPGAGLGASPDSDDEGGTIESQVCSQHLSVQTKRWPFVQGTYGSYKLSYPRLRALGTFDSRPVTSTWACYAPSIWLIFVVDEGQRKC